MNEMTSLDRQIADRDDWVWWAAERGWRFEVVEPFKWGMRRA